MFAEVGMGVLGFPPVVFLDLLQLSFLGVGEETRATLDDDDFPASNPDVKSAMSKSSKWASVKGLDDDVIEDMSLVVGCSVHACAWGNWKESIVALISDVILLSSSDEVVN